jgi:hypothetical protein
VNAGHPYAKDGYALEWRVIANKADIPKISGISMLAPAEFPKPMKPGRNRGDPVDRGPLASINQIPLHP